MNIKLCDDELTYAFRGTVVVENGRPLEPAHAPAVPAFRLVVRSFALFVEKASFVYA